MNDFPNAIEPGEVVGFHQNRAKAGDGFRIPFDAGAKLEEPGGNRRQGEVKVPARRFLEDHPRLPGGFAQTRRPWDPQDDIQLRRECRYEARVIGQASVQLNGSRSRGAEALCERPVFRQGQ